jgi:hypothetical protein
MTNRFQLFILFFIVKNVEKMREMKNCSIFSRPLLFTVSVRPVLVEGWSDGSWMSGVTLGDLW